MAFTGQAVFGGTTDPVTGSWNNATSLNSTVVSSDITGYGVIVASFVVTGTVTGGTAVFEVSDDGGTSWWPINGLQTGFNNQAMSYAFAGGSASWEFATGAYNLYRVRLNPVISGSGSVAIRISAEAFPFTTAIAISGTVSVQTIAGQNTVRLQDGTGTAITSTASALDVNIKSTGVTQPISGTVSVSGTVTTNIQASGTPLTATGSSLNVNITGGSTSGTQYTGSPAVGAGAVVSTLASGYDGTNVRPLLVSNAGSLHVVSDSGSTTVVTGTVAVNQTQLNSVALGSPSNYGTSPGAVAVQGVNAFVTNTVTVSGTVAATQSGTWTVQQGGAPWSTTVSGTVAVTQSTSPWVTSDNNALTQGSATSGQKGFLELGAVTTAAPAYTTAQSSPLSLTTAGALRVDGSGVTQPVSGTVAVSGTVTVSGTVAATQSGTWNIATVTTVTAVTSITNTVTVAGTVTANQGGAPWSFNQTQQAGVALGAPTNYGTAPGAVAVQGVNAFVTNTVPVTLASTTITGTVAITQSTSPWVDNITQWASTVLGTPQAFGTAPTGVVIGVSADMYHAGTRARSNQATTAAGVCDVNLVGILGATLSATNPLPGSVTDGSHGIVAVKAASTTPVATDPALVVTLSPNSAVVNVASVQGTKATYRATSGTVASNLFTSSFTPHAGVIFQLQGSATQIIRITHFSLSSSGASATYIDISGQRTSSAASGGTAVTPTVAKMDTADVAATAVAKYYTAAPTPGTFVGNVISERFFFPQAPYTMTYLDFMFGDLPGAKGFTLQGTGDFFTVQLTGSLPSTPFLSFYCEWTEASS